MTVPLNVLIVEDSEVDADLVLRHLTKAGYAVQSERVETVEAMKTALEQQEWDVVISDYNMPAFSAPAALRTLQQSGLDLPFFVVSGTIREETAIDLVRAGASDYLMKDRLARLPSLVKRELDVIQARRERTEAQAALRESEERFRHAMDASTDGLWDWNVETGQSSYSPSYWRMLGYAPDEFQGRHDAWVNLVHPEDLERAQTVDADCIENRCQAFTIEFRMKTKNGGWKWIMSRGKVLSRNPQGRALRVIGTHVDITERKQAEIDLKLANLKLEALWSVASLEDADLKNISDRLLATVTRMTASDIGFYGFMNASETAMTIHSWTAKTTQGCSITNQPMHFPISEAGLWAEAVRRREPFILNDFTAPHAAQKGLPQGHIPLSRLLVVPHFSHGKITAVVGVANRDAAYDANDITQITAFLTSIQALIDKKQAEEALHESGRFIHAALDALSTHIAILDRDGEIITVNEAWKQFARAQPLIGHFKTQEGQNYLLACEAAQGPGSEEARQFALGIRMVLSGEKNDFTLVFLCPTAAENHWFLGRVKRFPGERVARLIITHDDITQARLFEAALEKRIIALTQPQSDAAGIVFEDLFNLDDIQRLQDEFSSATGVASIITHPDGTPITRPSNFRRLCIGIIRKTEKGLANCYQSDAVLGEFSLQGPKIQPCLSGGLWDAGAGISVGDHHIANWLIGQVRDGTQTEEKIRQYAREIGANEEATVQAFYEVPCMDQEQFQQVARALSTLANQLSAMAYQNMQQARFITRQKQTEDALRKSEALLNDTQRLARMGGWEWDSQTGILTWSDEVYRIHGLTPDAISLNMEETLVWPRSCLSPENHEILLAAFQQCAQQGKPYELELPFTALDGEKKWIRTIGRAVMDAGRVIRVQGNMMDITERKQAEAQLKEQMDELRRWYTATTGREKRILELKQEINQLLVQAGAPPRYASAQETGAEEPSHD